MKKKVLLSSILTIVLCFSLIAGSTFALFTSKTQVDVTITAGKVALEAGVAITKLESVKADDTNGTITDEYGAKYSYETVSPTFTNGGTAEIINGVLTLDNITPGDKITFEITGANTSDVAAQYRYTVECLEGYKLMSGLVFTFEGFTDEYTSVASFTSPWTSIAKETNIDPVTVTVELPVKAGNEFQDTTTKIRIYVEAVQGNANVSTDTQPTVETLAAATDADSFATAITDPSVDIVGIANDMALTVGDIANKTIRADGNDVSFTFTGNLENVVIEGIVDTNGTDRIDVSKSTGDLTLKGCEFLTTGAAGNGAIYVGTTTDDTTGEVKATDLTIEDCKFAGVGTAKTYGIYGYSSGAITITNTTFDNFKSWAILVNGTAFGGVTVSGCTFDTTGGILKTLGGGVKGDFTFTNNTMITNGHDGNLDKVVVSGSGTDPVVCTGTKTVSGNTLNGAEWTQQ